jgi:hypothetical protein
MSFTVNVVKGDEPFLIAFGSLVADVDELIRSVYPDLTGHFRLITHPNGGNKIEQDLMLSDVFPCDAFDKSIVFLPAGGGQPSKRVCVT